MTLWINLGETKKKKTIERELSRAIAHGAMNPDENGETYEVDSENELRTPSWTCSTSPSRIINNILDMDGLAMEEKITNQKQWTAHKLFWSTQQTEETELAQGSTELKTLRMRDTLERNSQRLSQMIADSNNRQEMEQN